MVIGNYKLPITFYCATSYHHRLLGDVGARSSARQRSDGEELPARKFLILQYDADPENPYGVGIGQSCYWPWWFKKHGINMTKLESRPNRKKAWEYYFFVDLLGHADDARVKKALAELAKHTMFVKILGSYPNTNG